MGGCGVAVACVAPLRSDVNSPRTGQRVAIAAGANVGDAAASVRAAFDEIMASGIVENPRLSPLYRTAPVRVSTNGPDPGGPYVNATIVGESSADPENLLAILHEIERGAGRDRAGNPHGGPRPLDLDLLLVGKTIMATATLTLPHPRLHERAFVLVPLADIAPDLPVPGTGGPGQPPLTVAQLLARLGPLDVGAVRRIDP